MAEEIKYFVRLHAKLFTIIEGKKQIIPISENVDKILHRNWVILQELYEEAGTKKFFIPKWKLAKVGFKFEYHTTCQTNKQGKTYHYIYNYGWMDFSEKEFMIVRQSKAK